MPGFLRDFPAAGFHVLAIDSRAHGESGGENVTYGVVERDDMRRWYQWLRERPVCRAGVYALGLSMGAAIVLESLEGETGVVRAVAESPFASMEEIGRDRVHQLAPALGFLAVPMVRSGLLWAQWIRGVSLEEASPLRAAERIQVPVLLIHGTADRNVGIRHSELLLPRLKQARLWRVEGAGHVRCYGQNPRRYLEVVLGWLAGGVG